MLSNDTVAQALAGARAQGMSFKQLADRLRLPPGSRGALRDRLVQLLEAGRATFGNAGD